MPRARKQTKEELLRKKREAEKCRQERIKADPDLAAKEKKKNRLKYIKRKEKGQVRPINEYSDRQQRLIRKRWRRNTKNSRSQKESTKEFNVLLQDNTPPSTPESCQPCSSNVGSLQSRKIVGRKKVRKDRAAAYRRLKKTNESLLVYKRKYERYKKRFLRLRNKSDPSTPRSATRKLLKGQRVSPAIKRKLFVGAVLTAQLVDRYKTLRSKHVTREVYHRVIYGRIIKKYRCMKDCKLFFSRVQRKTTDNRPTTESVLLQRRQRSLALKGRELSKKVTTFFECDSNSRVCPGKRDTITRKGLKMQKRYLSDTVMNLHKKFSQQCGSMISYSRFASLRPFYLVSPKVSGRDTCLCVIHENMKLLVNKLSAMQVIESTTPTEIVKELCCDSSRETCLLRQCDMCKQQLIIYKMFVASDPANFQQWLTKREKRMCKSKEITVQITSKDVINSSVGDMVGLLEGTIGKFMKHIAYINHQYSAIDTLKQDLTNNAILIHIDFSENFYCKYNAEAQSVHFGASRTQITLHTGVYYFKKDNKIVTKSFCSLSKSLRHDPSGIWAHLSPVLQDIKRKFPDVSILHFLSDSPGTQYRNKKNFFLMSTYLPTLFPGLTDVTWNFSESGHGKGAPDGIGAVLKRTADRLVAEGSDISDFETLYNVLTRNCQGVQLFDISEEMISNVDKLIENEKLLTFVGTMKVHQVTLNFISPHLLSFRSLSCFQCGTGNTCSHYGVGNKLWAICSGDSSEQQESGMLEEQLVDLEVPMNYLDVNSLKVGDWVAVMYEQLLYPGEILKIEEDGMTVSVMEHVGKNKYKWPLKLDVCCYEQKDIIKKIRLLFLVEIELLCFILKIFHEEWINTEHHFYPFEDV